MSHRFVGTIIDPSYFQVYERIKDNKLYYYKICSWCGEERDLGFSKLDGRDRIITSHHTCRRDKHLFCIIDRPSTWQHRGFMFIKPEDEEVLKLKAEIEELKNSLSIRYNQYIEEEKKVETLEKDIEWRKNKIDALEKVIKNSKDITYLSKLSGKNLKLGIENRMLYKKFTAERDELLQLLKSVYETRSGLPMGLSDKIFKVLQKKAIQK